MARYIEEQATFDQSQIVGIQLASKFLLSQASLQQTHLHAYM